MKKIILLIYLLVLASSNSLFAQEIDSTLLNFDRLVKMDLEQLINVEISTASLTGSKTLDAPASITIIDKEQIKRSPARNLYDLLEVYVPGAQWVNHHIGAHLGMRGLIADRNYKFLLLVNGVNMNQKAQNGATSELENWDLGDIEKIEVIRGSGSVTYGAGAIMGVINIITKGATVNQKNGSNTTVSTNYVSRYKSKGFSISNTTTKKGITLFNYFSLQSTKGFVPNAYRVVNIDQYGYVGKDFDSGNNANEVQDYYADYRGKPQVKFHSQLTSENGWSGFIRYTQSGNSANGINPKTSIQEGFNPDSSVLLGPLENIKQLRNQHLTISAQKEMLLSDHLSSTTSITYDNENFIRMQTNGVTYQPGSEPFDEDLFNSASDIDHVRLKKHNFSEEEIGIRTILNYKQSSKLSIALGGEYVHNSWRAPWGKDEKSLRMEDGVAIISGIDSYAFGDGRFLVSDGLHVGEGWSTNTFAVFAEANYKINPNLYVLASGRMDKDTYSKMLLSPRVAIISELNSKNSIRLIALQSVRMNTATQLFIQNNAGITSKPEQIRSLELIYTGLPAKNFAIDLAGYYNKIDVLGWDSNVSSTNLVGNMSLYGLELSLKYKVDKLDIGFNHSYTHMKDWQLKDDVPLSGISYSNYNLPVTYTDDDGIEQEVTLTGAGNSINNWSSNASKIFANYYPTTRMTVHINAQMFYKFGNVDGIDLISSAVDALNNATSYQNQYRELLRDVQRKDSYQVSMRLNASISYDFGDHLEAILFVQSIPMINNINRYSYDSGNSRLVPNKIGFVEEPTFFGAKAIWSF
jgi:outer membrane receptor for ferrienterochelin and colicin